MGMVFVFFVLMWVWVLPVAAQYQFVTVEVPFPGASATAVTGINANNVVVGTYTDAGQRLVSFVCLPGQDVQPLPFVALSAIGTSGAELLATVQTFTSQSLQRGLLVHDGETFILDGVHPQIPPDPSDLVQNGPVTLSAFTPDGRVLGDYRKASDGQSLGFLYDPATQTATAIDFPVVKTRMGLAGMTSSGGIVGYYIDDSNIVHGVLFASGLLTPIEAPGATNTQPTGVTPDGFVVGIADDTGFTLQGTTYNTLSVPGATLTRPLGVRADGVIYGHWFDGTTTRGFVAFPSGVTLPDPPLCTDVTPQPAVHERHERQNSKQHKPR